MTRAIPFFLFISFFRLPLLPTTEKNVKMPKKMKIFYKTLRFFGGTMFAEGARTHEKRNKNGSL